MKKKFQELIKQGEGYFVEFKKQAGGILDSEMVFLRSLITVYKK